MRTTGIVVVLSCAGCQTEPLCGEVVGLPTVVKRGESVSFTVRVKNRSKKVQLLPDEMVLRFETGVRFFPGMKPSEYRPGEGSIDRGSLDICPPTFEKLGPRGTRDYAFEWMAPRNVQGDGAFVIALPTGLPQVKVRAMRVE